jgi:hypothetical protein
MSAQVTIYGNYGQLTVAVPSGEILAYQPEEGEAPEYADIARFDLAEFKQAYGYNDAKLAGMSIDILDIGAWFKGGNYSPPEFEWRAIPFLEIDFGKPKSLQRFSNYEIRPCIEWEDHTESFESLEEAQARMNASMEAGGPEREIIWTLYGRYDGSGGWNGCDAIGDFESREAAEFIAIAIAGPKWGEVAA